MQKGPAYWRYVTHGHVVQGCVQRSSKTNHDSKSESRLSPCSLLQFLPAGSCPSQFLFWLLLMMVLIEMCKTKHLQLTLLLLVFYHCNNHKSKDICGVKGLRVEPSMIIYWIFKLPHCYLNICVYVYRTRVLTSFAENLLFIVGFSQWGDK